MCWSHLVSSLMIPNIESISLSIGIGHRSQYQTRNRNFSFLGLSIIPGLEKLLPLVSVSASVSEKLVSPTSVVQLYQVVLVLKLLTREFSQCLQIRLAFFYLPNLAAETMCPETIGGNS